jgi:4-amino-4-deoxy-L-arabinose transferase-like glycosyltransferase
MPQAGAERVGPRTALTAGILATGLVRLAVFPFAQNFYGDPVMRLHALAAWMQHPFFLRSFVGARQFGPLHLYLLAAMELLTREQLWGPRLLSLAFGTLTAWPLYELSARRFGTRAGLWSTLAFATYGLHVQASTTAVSEAVFLFFVLAGLALLDGADDRHGWRVLTAGLSMACAGAVRYDGWLYAPLSAFWLVTPLRQGRLSGRWVLTYLALVTVVPAFLMWGNWVDMGDPLYLMHYIDQDHVMNAQRASAQMGRLWYGAYCLAFWPANLTLEMTPLLFAACVTAIVSSIRAGEARDLFVIAAIPAAYLTLKGALLLEFHPLARFTIPTAVLLLPYAGRGLEIFAARLSVMGRRVLLTTAALTAVGIPAFLAARTLGHGDVWADTMRPVSPISNLPPDLSRAAAWLSANAQGRKVVLGTNWLYEELPIWFYAGLTGEQLWNLRFGPLPEGFGQPDLIVLPKDSEQIGRSAFTVDGDGLSAYGHRFESLLDIGRVRVFAAVGPSG